MTTTEPRTHPITPQEERDIEREFYDSQPMKSTCTICGLSFEGTAKGVRESAIAHRTAKHPEVAGKRSRRSTRSLRSFRTRDMSQQDIDEIEKERRRRAFLTGVEIEE